MTVRIGVHGAAGRMGVSVMRAVGERDDTELVFAVDRPEAGGQGDDVGALIDGKPRGVRLTSNLPDVLAAGRVDVVIDFSAPAALAAALPQLRHHGVALVTGTTGLNADQQALLDAAAGDMAVFRADNFSIGVALMRKLVRDAAAVLGESADAEIIEAHHRHKVDAPSGTALAVGRAIAQGWETTLEERATWARHGITGEREAGRIGFSVVRGGDIVGEHTALFALDGERIEITHKATDRMVFARGAVRAALWSASQLPGRYGMEALLSNG